VGILSRTGGFAGATMASACRSRSLGVAVGAGVGMELARAIGLATPATAGHDNLMPGKAQLLATPTHTAAARKNPRTPVPPPRPNPRRRGPRCSLALKAAQG